MPKERASKSTPVIMNMTGDEFKRLIEQRDPNGIVDTVQELLKMFEGMNDDETLPDYIQRVAEEAKAQEAVYEEESETLFINGAKPKEKEEEG